VTGVSPAAARRVLSSGSGSPPFCGMPSRERKTSRVMGLLAGSLMAGVVSFCWGSACFWGGACAEAVVLYGSWPVVPPPGVVISMDPLGPAVEAVLSLFKSDWAACL
jgi:hypothetical protein